MPEATPTPTTTRTPTRTTEAWRQRKRTNTRAFRARKELEHGVAKFAQMRRDAEKLRYHDKKRARGLETRFFVTKHTPIIIDTPEEFLSLHQNIKKY